MTRSTSCRRTAEVSWVESAMHRRHELHNNVSDLGVRDCVHSVPLRHMLTYVNEVATNLKRRWPHSVLYVLGHVGDGNLHFFISPGTPSPDSKAAHAIADEIVYHPLRQFDGAVSAEHGIGLEKKAWMPLSRSAAEMELMRVLKRSIDPKGILNRGKVIDV
jgi:FAD/FMN-containing dehydrogenase